MFSLKIVQDVRMLMSNNLILMSGAFRWMCGLTDFYLLAVIPAGEESELVVGIKNDGNYSKKGFLVVLILNTVAYFMFSQSKVEHLLLPF